MDMKTIFLSVLAPLGLMVALQGCSSTTDDLNMVSAATTCTASAQARCGEFNQGVDLSNMCEKSMAFAECVAQEECCDLEEDGKTASAAIDDLVDSVSLSLPSCVFTNPCTTTATVTTTVTVTAAGATETTTATVTVTGTATVTATLTATATSTVTATVTETATATVTETVTATVTETATATVTETVTATDTTTLTTTVTTVAS